MIWDRANEEMEGAMIASMVTALLLVSLMEKFWISPLVIVNVKSAI